MGSDGRMDLLLLFHWRLFFYCCRLYQSQSKTKLAAAEWGVNTAAISNLKLSLDKVCTLACFATL
jgi:hypothetical protein